MYGCVVVFGIEQALVALLHRVYHGSPMNEAEALLVGKMKQLIEDTDELTLQLQEIRSAEVNATIAGLQGKLFESLQALLLLALHKANAPTKNLELIGNHYALIASQFWDKQTGKYSVQFDPAKIEAIRTHVEKLQHDLNEDRCLTSYKVSEWHIGCPPSNEDLDIVEDYVDIVSGGHLVFSHAAPCLDTPVSPSTQALLDWRKNHPDNDGSSPGNED